MRRRFDLFLNDILDCIDKIEEYTGDLDIEEFKKSKITIDASVRNIEIIGEAVSQLPLKIKEKYTEVPWQDIKNFRNIVIHQYHRIDIDILWDIIQHNLEPLRQQINVILAKEKKND